MVIETIISIQLHRRKFVWIDSAEELQLHCHTVFATIQTDWNSTEVPPN